MYPKGLELCFILLVHTTTINPLKELNIHFQKKVELIF